MLKENQIVALLLFIGLSTSIDCSEINKDEEESYISTFSSKAKKFLPYLQHRIPAARNGSIAEVTATDPLTQKVFSADGAVIRILQTYLKTRNEVPHTQGTQTKSCVFCHADSTKI